MTYSCKIIPKFIIISKICSIDNETPFKFFISPFTLNIFDENKKVLTQLELTNSISSILQL